MYKVQIRITITAQIFQNRVVNIAIHICYYYLLPAISRVLIFKTADWRASTESLIVAALKFKGDASTSCFSDRRFHYHFIADLILDCLAWPSKHTNINFWQICSLIRRLKAPWIWPDEKRRQEISAVWRVHALMRCRSQMCETYERATLPINEGETALRNVGFVFSTAFACSLASSKDLAKAFPQWIKLDRNDNFLRIASGFW